MCWYENEIHGLIKLPRFSILCILYVCLSKDECGNGEEEEEEALAIYFVVLYTSRESQLGGNKKAATLARFHDFTAK